MTHRFRPYAARKYRCKCAERRTAIHFPGRRFYVGRFGPDQWVVHDMAAGAAILSGVNKWPKCLGEEIIERFRSGELKRREWTILHGQIHVLPK